METTLFMVMLMYSGDNTDGDAVVILSMKSDDIVGEALLMNVNKLIIQRR